MLFCLLRRKDEDVYLRLLLKIEEMATARNAKIFNRKVRVMCDFERAFINAVSKKYKDVAIRCCFFHYVENVRKHTTNVITLVKKRAGSPRELAYAQTTKRRLMMLPLLPPELITADVVNLVIAKWRTASATNANAFDELRSLLLTSYVGECGVGVSRANRHFSRRFGASLG